MAPNRSIPPPWKAWIEQPAGKGPVPTDPHFRKQKRRPRLPASASASVRNLFRFRRLSAIQSPVEGIEKGPCDPRCAMFAWLFGPSCPCDPAAKSWIEERLSWLSEEFEDSAFSSLPVVEPTPEFFPDPYDGSKRAVRRLLDRVCEYMGVVPDLVALKFVADAGKIWLVNESGDYLPHAAGTYQEGRRKFIIRLDRSGLDDPMGLVGTMAHELAHARLLGEGRILREAFDNELLTDLTVVFFGLGIFLANTPRHWDSQFTKWPGTNLLKPEYLTPPMFGYGLAHLAWHRGESRPAWARHLNWAARANFNQGLRYLQKTADSAFKPWHHRLGNES